MKTSKETLLKCPDCGTLQPVFILDNNQVASLKLACRSCGKSHLLTDFLGFNKPLSEGKFEGKVCFQLQMQNGEVRNNVINESGMTFGRASKDGGPDVGEILDLSVSRKQLKVVLLPKDIGFEAVVTNIGNEHTLVSLDGQRLQYNESKEIMPGMKLVLGYNNIFIITDQK
jgi:hypothetical protein